MSVYVMERRGMMTVVTENGKVTQKGTKVKKGERDSSSAVQCGMLVLRCIYMYLCIKHGLVCVYWTICITRTLQQNLMQQIHYTCQKV